MANSEHVGVESWQLTSCAPEAPAALIAVKNIGKVQRISTFTPIVLQAANDMTAMVTTAPTISMVALVGIEIGCVHI